MVRRNRNFSHLLLIIVWLVSLNSLGINSASHALAQTEADIAIQQAEMLLETLTPEERVGQLFLVTFVGSTISSDSNIYRLITDHHVGGVILLRSNNNITTEEQSSATSVPQLLALNRQLQQDEWNSSQRTMQNPATGGSFQPAYIPLFIGMSQEGDGYPYDQVLEGMTPLPNEMALGATWNPERAAQVATVLGKELSILGINLVLGPSLDVLENSQVEATNSLGTRTFGGDPYWVGEMGRAYIRGLHQGSEGRVAVVAKHFPGHGSSDRLPEEEVASVRKSLEQLKSFDLAPFFTATGNAISLEETTDALLVSHIRYQGLQGNIRATTRPVSFDPQALGLLLNLPALDTWRKNGGVVVSDDLGSQAVRRFYDLTSQTFEARRVALNAFIAGNDLLYIADFTSENELDSYLAAEKTLDFFAQKYREDAAFSQRVDESVKRILALKYRLYENFSLSNVLPTQLRLNELNQASQVTFEVARESATLISPTQAELDDTIPDPPNQNDRIVIVSDVRSGQQCQDCPTFPLLDTKSLQDAIIRLYGPQAGGQVTAHYVTSYSLEDLEYMLDNERADTQFLRDIGRANWIVFAMLGARSDIPSFQTLSRFLTERPDLFLQKRLIVFAFCAPYHLDATNISKLTAYYGLYSKSPQFIDLAAYLLFRELLPVGALPISVLGSGYDLNQALFPDPDQVISLELDLPQATTPVPTSTAIPQPTEFRVGDLVPVRTGVILDHNGHPVPDGTPVNFIFSTGVETTAIRQVETTKFGIARTIFPVTSSGTLEIYAESENARSPSIKLDIPSSGGENLTTTEITPPTQAPEPTPMQSNVETPEPPINDFPPRQLGFGDWIVALLISGVFAWVSYRIAALIGQIRWGIRAGLLSLLCGLLSYTYLALKLPGSEGLLEASIARSVFLITLGGAVLGLLATLIWNRFAMLERRRSASRQLNNQKTE